MILASPNDLQLPPSRIVSLVPSQTELLYWLGLDNETIAITKFCVHPDEWFRTKIRIGGTKALDIEKVISLDPGLIIANKEENVKGQVEELAKDFPVWVTDVNNLADAYQMIEDIGQLTRKHDEAKKLVETIQSEFNSINLIQTRSVPTAYLIWKDPYMTVGSDTFINSMMEVAGLKNVFASQQRYPEITIQQLKESSCELVLLSSEPYPFSQKHINELQQQLPGKKIILVDGEIFSWYGSRLLKAPQYFRILMDELNNRTA